MTDQEIQSTFNGMNLEFVCIGSDGFARAKCKESRQDGAVYYSRWEVCDGFLLEVDGQWMY